MGRMKKIYIQIIPLSKFLEKNTRLLSDLYTFIAHASSVDEQIS